MGRNSTSDFQLTLRLQPGLHFIGEVTDVVELDRGGDYHLVVVVAAVVVATAMRRAVTSRCAARVKVGASARAG